MTGRVKAERPASVIGTAKDGLRQRFGIAEISGFMAQ
jgi:hypothetical protein